MSITKLSSQICMAVSSFYYNLCTMRLFSFLIVSYMLALLLIKILGNDEDAGLQDGPPSNSSRSEFLKRNYCIWLAGSFGFI